VLLNQFPSLASWGQADSLAGGGVTLAVSTDRLQEQSEAKKE
jgi:hypothetical protein